MKVMEKRHKIQYINRYLDSNNKQLIKVKVLNIISTVIMGVIVLITLIILNLKSYNYLEKEMKTFLSMFLPSLNVLGISNMIAQTCKKEVLKNKINDLKFDLIMEEQDKDEKIKRVKQYIKNCSNELHKAKIVNIASTAVLGLAIITGISVLNYNPTMDVETEVLNLALFITSMVGVCDFNAMISSLYRKSNLYNKINDLKVKRLLIENDEEISLERKK